MSNKIVLIYQDKEFGSNIKYLLEKEFNLKVIGLFTSHEDYSLALETHNKIIKDYKLLIIQGDIEFSSKCFNSTIDKFHNEKVIWHFSDDKEIQPYIGFKPVHFKLEDWFINIREEIKKSFKRETTIPVKEFVQIPPEVMKQIIEVDDIVSLFKVNEDGSTVLKDDLYLLMKTKTFKFFNKDDNVIMDDKKRILEKIKISQQNNIKILFALKRKTYNYIIIQTQKYEKALDSRVNKEALVKIKQLRESMNTERNYSLGEYGRRLNQASSLGQAIVEQAETQLMLQEEYITNKKAIDKYIKKSGSIQNEVAKMKSMNFKNFLKNSLNVKEMKEIITKSSKKADILFHSRAELVARTACYLAIKKGYNFAGDKLVKSSFLCDMMLRGRPELFFIRTKNELNEAINRFNLTEAEQELVESHAFLTSKMINKFYNSISQSSNTLDEDYFKITEQHHYIPEEDYLGILMDKIKKHQVKALSIIFIISQEFGDYIYKATLKKEKINYKEIILILKSRYGKSIEFMNTIKVLEEAYLSK